jgi:RNA polymerase sigma-70 factor (ECF subfamily)
MSEPNLTHAIVRCQAGDKQSFRLIADFHGDRLYGIAFLILNDRGRAEDAAQEALIQAWRHIKRFRAGAQLSPWLNRILLNEIKKQGRRARHPETPIEEAFQLRDSGRTPEQHAIDSETSAHLWNRVQALPEEQRIALVLRYYLGYTTPEIAQSTGWAQGTVRSRLSRGVAALRKSVDPSLFAKTDGKTDNR